MKLLSYFFLAIIFLTTAVLPTSDFVDEDEINHRARVARFSLYPMHREEARRFLIETAENPRSTLRQKARAYVGLSLSQLMGNTFAAFYYGQCGKEADPTFLDARLLSALLQSQFGNPSLAVEDYHYVTQQTVHTDSDRQLKAMAFIELGKIFCSFMFITNFISEVYTDHQVQQVSGLFREALNLLGDNGDTSLRAQALIGLGITGSTDQDHQQPSDWHLEANNLMNTPHNDGLSLPFSDFSEEDFRFSEEELPGLDHDEL